MRCSEPGHRAPVAIVPRAGSLSLGRQAVNGTTMTRLEKVIGVLESENSDWDSVSLAEVQTAIHELIGKRRQCRRIRSFTERSKRLQELGIRLRSLFPILARKWADRGMPALLEKLTEVRGHLEDSERINNYDDLYYEALKREYDRLSNSVCAE